MLTAEDGVAPVENTHQILQILGFKQFFSHQVLLDIEGTEETGLLEIQIPDHTPARRVVAAAGFGTDQVISEGNTRA